jgi:acyl-CoA synthetase (AMP-forming)/AMP-acid ligase II
MEYQLADLFEALCDARPDAPVLVAGGRHYTRGELDARANRLAHYLISRGVKPGDHIGVYAYNRAEWVETLLACWKLRATAININYRYVTDELRYIWNNADMVALVYEKTFAPHIAALRDGFPGITSYLVLDDGNANFSHDVDYEFALAAQSPERNFPAPYVPRSRDDIFMIYTGGTTGMPKGVLWRHFDFYHNVICMNTATEKPESILQYADNPKPLRSLTLSPLMHGGGQFAVIIALMRGGVACIPVSRSLNPAEILDTVEKEKITLMSLIGDAMARPIAEEQLRSIEQGRQRDLGSLAIISSGGAILTEPARELLKKAFGEKIYFAGGIGGSEIGSAAVEAGNHHQTTGPRFKANAMMAVLDDKLDVIVPGEDRVGYLAMKGFIPLGYYKDPEKTAAVFKTDQHDVRWVLAGDRAKVERDGTFTLVGRDSQCINSGGEKIFVEEVERAIALHPAVRFCAVVGVPDPKWMQRVAAVVELQPGQSLTLEQLQTHCRQHIAGYKLPRELWISEMKRTPNGKIDYVWVKNFAVESAKSSAQSNVMPAKAGIQ